MSCCIHITDNYYLRSDPYQWIIAQYVGETDKGKRKFDNLSFHVTPVQAIDSLSQRLLRACGANNMNGLVEASRLIHKMATDACMTAVQAHDNITLKVEIK